MAFRTMCHLFGCYGSISRMGRIVLDVIRFVIATTFAADGQIPNDVSYKNVGIVSPHSINARGDI